MVSTGATAVVRTWDKLSSGKISGLQGAFARAYDDVQTKMSSQLGDVGIGAFGDVQAQVDAGLSAAISTLGQFDGAIDVPNKSAYVTAVNGLGGRIHAGQDALVATMDKMKASIVANRDVGIPYAESVDGDVTGGTLYYNVLHDVSGNVTATDVAGGVYIEAEEVPGNVTSAVMPPLALGAP